MKKIDPSQIWKSEVKNKAYGRNYAVFIRTHGAPSCFPVLVLVLTVDQDLIMLGARIFRQNHGPAIEVGACVRVTRCEI